MVFSVSLKKRQSLSIYNPGEALSQFKKGAGKKDWYPYGHFLKFFSGYIHRESIYQFSGIYHR
jgi:hypothetical protein